MKRLPSLTPILFLIPFSVGIMLHITSQKLLLFAVVGIALSGVVLFIESRLHYTLQYRLRSYTGITALILILCLGYIVTALHTHSRFHHFSDKLPHEKAVVLQITVAERPVKKPSSHKAVVTVEAISNGQSFEKTKGKMLMYFLTDSSANTPRVAQRYQVRCTPKTISPPRNPEEFNYREYLSFQNIYHQAAVSANDRLLLAENTANPLLTGIYALREKLHETVHTHLPHTHSQAVASAVMLGIKDDMDQPLIHAYASAGALHVLAVSGLHVGVFYIMIAFLLKLLIKGQRKSLWIAVISILLIWCYAFLTGASPSVLRAATMFSFISFSGVLSRSANIYNLIAASAILLMAVNPYILTEVGFKLSYLAVIGIVALQPRIVKLWAVKNKVLRFFWQITAVSLAAQITTFPIGLLYFHQFPMLFPISNLIVIPAASIILYLGIALFVFSPVNSIATAIGFMLSWLIEGVNRIMFLIDQLPHSLIEGISISGIEALLIYTSIACMILFVYHRKGILIFGGLLPLLTVSSLNLYEQRAQQKNNFITVYAVDGVSAIAVLNGRQLQHSFPASLSTNESKMLFHIRHDWWQLGVKRHSKTLPDSTHFFLPHKDGGILNVNGFCKHPPLAEDVATADIVILSNNPYRFVKNNAVAMKEKSIVLDGSNSKRFAAYCSYAANEYNFTIWNVLTEGAFRKKL